MHERTIGPATPVVRLDATAPGLAYALAGLLGLAWALLLMPLPTILGAGPLWAAPNGDNAQALAGHLAFQRDAWRFPLLFARTIFWPGGLSVAMVDSNSLFSLIGKLAAGPLGHPVNLLGLWWALCWGLQPVTALYALRGFGIRGLVPGLVAAALAALTPAMLARIYHINLCGHFLLLAMLGTTAGLLRGETRRRWWLASGILLVAILAHPYLFAYAAAVLAAVPAQRGIEHWRSGLRLLPRLAGPTLLRFLAAAFGPLLVFMLLSGTTGGGDHGFAIFSMNLASPFWPQQSGLFGADLPILDGTGGQYEGFNYLGAGTLLLLAVALVARLRGRFQPHPRRFRGLVLVLAGLFLLALSSRIYLGPIRLLNLGLKPWEDIFATVRASGRAFWPVGYALMLLGVAGTARLPRRLAWPIFAVALLLQWIDTGPLRHKVESMMADGLPQPVLPALPTGGRLLTLVPSPGCGPDTRGSNLLLLKAVRADMDLGDIGVGRPPRWFNCEKLLSDSSERPLRRAELRVFTAPVQPLIREELMGPGAVCVRAETQVICGGADARPPGPPLDLRHALPALAADGNPAPLLSFAWATDAAGLPWSEGPRASLAFAAPEGARHLTLVLKGVGERAGIARPVVISGPVGVLAEVDLPDGQPDSVVLTLPAGLAPGSPFWLGFDFIRPVDPKRRDLAAPVNRAALRLVSIRATP